MRFTLVFFSLFGKMLVFSPFMLFAQRDTSAVDFLLNELQHNIEIYSDEDEEKDLLQAFSDIWFESGRKFNINTLTPEEGLYVLQLSEYQYYQLQLYIEKYGMMYSIYELYAMEGFDRKDVERVLPFICASRLSMQVFSLKRIIKNLKHEVLLRYAQVLERQAGYDNSRNSHYLGSPCKLLFRYKVSYSPFFSLGLAGEKDPGEEFFKGNRKEGFDHYSFHLNIKNVGLVKSVILGDYKLDFGQGLVLGSGLIRGKGAGVSYIRKLSSGIRPITAMNEGDYLQGVASTIGTSRYSVTFFLGRRSYDGNLSMDETNGMLFFEGTLNVKGNHRTIDEVRKRKVMRSNSYGASMEYRGNIFRAGIQGYYSHFTANVLPGDALYQLYNFSGKSSFVVGTDYQCLLGKLILYGEAAVSALKGFAFLQGVSFSPDSRLKLAMLVRYYNQNYFALHGKGFGENNVNNNELGLYLTSELLLGKRITLILSGDAYRFLWLRYRIDKPVTGFDFSVRMKIKLRGNVQMQLIYSFKEKKENILRDDCLNEISAFAHHMGRVELEYSPFDFLSLKSLFGMIGNKRERIGSIRYGFLLYQDINFSFSRISTDIKARIAVFDTDSYEERIYAYEHDLYYVFNITPYYYRGSKFYLMLKYKWKYFDISFRIAQLVFIDKKTIGSGLELIDRNRKTEVKLQLLFRL